MDIIQQEKNKWDIFLKYFFDCTNEYRLTLLSKLLEDYDRELAATRRKSLIIIKKVSRTILTSYGYITFKRRYYFDTVNDSYTYLLDSTLSIPKYSRLSKELKIRIINSLDHLSYKDAGIDMLPDNCSISPVTVFNILNDCSIITNFKPFNNQSKKIHVQLDEKYIHMRSRKSKSSNKRLYTACIFSNIDKTSTRHKLLNRTILSARKIDDLFNKINFFLKNIYQVSINDNIYISGDLATYIQNSPERITVCSATYVPDKFHVQTYLKKYLGYIIDDDFMNHFDDYIQAFINDLSCLNNLEKDNNFNALFNLLINNPNSIKNWFNDDYLGCSQEAINSHFFSNRLDKKPNSFSYKSLDSICTLMNAKNNNFFISIILKESFYEPYFYQDDLVLLDLFDDKFHSYISFENYNFSVRHSLKKLSFL